MLQLASFWAKHAQVVVPFVPQHECLREGCSTFAHSWPGAAWQLPPMTDFKEVKGQMQDFRGEAHSMACFSVTLQIYTRFLIHLKTQREVRTLCSAAK